MKKTLFAGLVTGMTVFAMSSTAFALIVQSETGIMNPVSTENLWAYSYDDTAPYITSASDYVRAGDDYRTNATFQGYVTGAFGPWSGTGVHDSWGSEGASDFQSTHVFDTYITSTIDQTVTFSSSGDDGNSFFVNDVFLNGAGYYPAGNVVTATFNMIANTQYKLSYIGSNWTGPFAWWFNMSGVDTSGAVWTGAVSEAYNITMNAVGGDPVPEPATMVLFGTGLMGLVGSRIRKKKKVIHS